MNCPGKEQWLPCSGARLQCPRVGIVIRTSHVSSDQVLEITCHCFNIGEKSQLC